MQAGNARAGGLSLDDGSTSARAPGQARRERQLALAFLGLGLGFAAVARFALRSVPLERDEGIYAYFGRLILDGAIPYVSFYEIKPPGLYYAYAGVVAVFGDGIAGLHLGFAVINLVTIVVVYAAGARLLRPLFGGMAAASYAVLSLLPGLSGFTIQSEHWIALFASLSFYASLHALERGSRPLLLLAAVLAGTAMTIKQSGVLFVMAVGAFVLLDHASRRERARPHGVVSAGLVADVALVAAGTLLVYGGAALAMAWLGAFEDFWFWTVEFPKTYVTQIGASGGVERFFRYLVKVTENAQALWLLAGLGWLATLFAPGAFVARGMVVAFSVLSFVAIVPGQRFYGHYWIQALPAVSLLVGAGALGLERLVRRVAPGRLGLPTRIAVGAFVLAIAQPLVAERSYFFTPDPDDVLRRVYLANPFPEAKVVGDFLVEHMEADDSLVVIGSEPQLYLYTDRRLESRHAYFEYVIIRHPRHVEWQREFMLDIEKSDPEWIVFFDHATSLGGDVDPESRARFLTWFRRYVDRKGYTPVGVADMIDLGETQYTWSLDGVGSALGRGTAKVVVYRRPRP